MTILERVLRQHRPAGRASDHQRQRRPARFIDFGLPVIPDDLPDHPGPLAGIVGAMDYAAEFTACTEVLCVAADCPFLPADLAARLGKIAGLRNARIAVAHSGGFAQPRSRCGIRRCVMTCAGR